MADEDSTGRENDAADGVATQLDGAETLLDQGSDWLDAGYSPPDREPFVQVPTEREGERGLSLDDLLAAEEPDVGAGRDPNLFDESAGEAGNARAGRLVDSDEGAYADLDRDLWARDVGIDGAAASAEEAAVHVIDDEGED